MSLTHHLTAIDFARAICLNCRDLGKPEPVAGRVLFDKVNGTISGMWCHALGKIDGKERFAQCAASRLYALE